MRIANETFIEQKDMAPDALITYLSSSLDRAIVRESKRAREAASLDDLLRDLLVELADIETLTSCAGPARKHISRVIIRTQKSMEEIARGKEYRPRTMH
jgi:hypothetical protein